MIYTCIWFQCAKTIYVYREILTWIGKLELVWPKDWQPWQIGPIINLTFKLCPVLKNTIGYAFVFNTSTLPFPVKLLTPLTLSKARVNSRIDKKKTVCTWVQIKSNILSSILQFPVIVAHHIPFTNLTILLQPMLMIDECHNRPPPKS